LLRATPAPRGGAASTYDFVSHGGHTSLTPQPPSPPPLGHRPGAAIRGEGRGRRGGTWRPRGSCRLVCLGFPSGEEGGHPCRESPGERGEDSPPKVTPGGRRGYEPPPFSPGVCPRGPENPHPLRGGFASRGCVCSFESLPPLPRGGGEGLQSERESPPSNVRGPPPLKFFQLPTPVTIAFSISNFKFF